MSAWTLWIFIEPPVPLLPLNQTYGSTGMKDGGRGETETPPQLTLVHVHDGSVG